MEGNNKKIFVTDTHLGVRKSSPVYLEVVYNLFVDICRKAKEEGIKELIHAGDFFDNRKHLTLNTIDYAEKIGSLLSETFENVFFILGNHDLFYKDQYFPTSHQLFTRYENIHIIHTPTVHDNILMIPWILEGDDTSDLFKLKADYCIGHFDIIGAKMGLKTEAKEGRFSFLQFGKFKGVYSGHFHTPGTYGNVTYLGAPYHMTFNDGGPRGYYIFDDGDLEFVEWSGYPQFVHIIARDDLYNECDIKGKMVKLVFQTDYGTLKNAEIVKTIQSLEPMRLFTSYDFGCNMTNDRMDETENLELKDAEGIHLEFVEKSEVPETLNKKTVLQMISTLYKELKGENDYQRPIY